MSEPDEALIEAIAKALLDEGAAPGNNLHSWRCEYPETYGPCDCVQEVARAAYAAMVEHLGLRWQDWAEIWGMDAPKRRLVSKWQEVEP